MLLYSASYGPLMALLMVHRPIAMEMTADVVLVNSRRAHGGFPYAGGSRTVWFIRKDRSENYESLFYCELFDSLKITYLRIFVLDCQVQRPPALILLTDLYTYNHSQNLKLTKCYCRCRSRRKERTLSWPEFLLAC